MCVCGGVLIAGLTSERTPAGKDMLFAREDRPRAFRKERDFTGHRIYTHPRPGKKPTSHGLMGPGQDHSELAAKSEQSTERDSF